MSTSLVRLPRLGALAAVSLSLAVAACTPGAPQEEPSSGAGGTGAGGTTAPAATGGTSAGGSGGTTSSASGGTTPAAGGTTTPAATGGTTSAGTGGTPAPASDAGSADTGTPSAPAPSGGDKGPFTCTSVIGINATGEWYKRGFEKLVDNDKWQLVQVHSAFIERWADPNNGFWKTAPTSPCAQNSASPDRVLFVVLNFDYDKLEQWMPALTATAKNLRMRYPNAKVIELGTYVRAPGNKGCPQREAARSQIHETQDQAIEMVVAANPDIFRVAPKFEAKACNEFSGNPPHPSEAGGMAWATRIAAHYNGTASAQ